jgi:hypothetical protein
MSLISSRDTPGAEGQDEQVLLRELYQLQPAEDGDAAGAQVLAVDCAVL